MERLNKGKEVSMPKFAIGDKVKAKNLNNGSCVGHVIGYWHPAGYENGYEINTVHSNLTHGVSVQFTYPEYNYSHICMFRYNEIILYKNESNNGLGYLTELERAIDLT